MPIEPPPITRISVWRGVASVGGTGVRRWLGVGSSSKGASNSPSSNISAAAGTGLAGRRGAAKLPASGVPGHRRAMVAAQKRPWQRPMPARVAFLSDATETKPLPISCRSRPAVTSSHRQMMVSSVIPSVGGGVTGR